MQWTDVTDPAVDSPHGISLPEGACPELRTPAARGAKSQQDWFMGKVDSREREPVREAEDDWAIAEGWRSVALLGVRAVAAEVTAVISGAEALDIYLDGGLVLVDVLGSRGESLRGTVAPEVWDRLVAAAGTCLITGADTLHEEGKAERTPDRGLRIPLSQDFTPRNPF